MMNAKWIVVAVLFSMGTVACSSETESTAPVESESPETPALNIALRQITLEEIGGAVELAAVCETEVAALSEGITVLEGWQGSLDKSYLTALDRLVVNATNMSYRASTLSAVHPDSDLRDAGDSCVQSLTRSYSDLTLSRPIYEAVSQINAGALDAETQRHVEKLLLGFRLAGVDQDEATRERVKALNDEIVAIGQEFDRNIIDDIRYLELESVDDLAGLPQDYIDAHPPDEDGIIRISTQYPDLFPFLTYAQSDELRRQMLTLYNTLAHPENVDVLHRLLEQRYELATLLGFENYAELITADKMSGSPERVEAFLEELRNYTTQASARDYEMLLERLRQDQPDAVQVMPWQRVYLSEKVRKEQFEVDSKVVRQYFNYEDTRDGILTLIQDLFGLEFRVWETPAWHEDVESYELYDQGRLIGRFYLDMHPREGKYQHAAAFPMQPGITGEQLPISTLVCNFPSGRELMQHAQVVTFLHEFGHLMHGLLAGEHQWSSVSGISTEWDFVEAPSQMLQEWVWDYETVSLFARNEAGEPLPRDLLDRMIAARDFGLGMNTRRQLSFAALSLGLYKRNPEGLDIKALADEIDRKFTPFAPLEGGHYYTSFGHLNGYSAIYYTYQWSLAIAFDLFTRFENEGLRNVETAGAYRDAILAPGGARPAAELVRDFLGRDVSFKTYADRLSGKTEQRIETREAATSGEG